MKIKMRYEDAYQTLEVETKEIEKWLNISISEEKSQEDYEKRVQDEIEVQFNRPDYNNGHKFDRHTGNAYMKSKDGTVEVNTEKEFQRRLQMVSAGLLSKEKFVAWYFNCDEKQAVEYIPQTTELFGG